MDANIKRTIRHIKKLQKDAKVAAVEALIDHAERILGNHPELYMFTLCGGGACFFKHSPAVMNIDGYTVTMSREAAKDHPLWLPKKVCRSIELFFESLEAVSSIIDWEYPETSYLVTSKRPEAVGVVKFDREFKML